MGKNRGSNRLKTQIEPESDRRAGASAVVFHFPFKHLCLRQPSCGGVRLFSSGKVRIPIRAVEDLASVPESQPDSPTDADALDPEPRAVNQPNPQPHQVVAHELRTRHPFPLGLIQLPGPGIVFVCDPLVRVMAIALALAQHRPDHRQQVPGNRYDGLVPVHAPFQFDE